jgi:hypothetical protein
MSRLTEAKITASDSAVMLCANGNVQYGNARFQKIAPISMTTTPWSFIYALGPDMTCRNADYLIRGTLPG